MRGSNGHKKWRFLSDVAGHCEFDTHVRLRQTGQYPNQLINIVHLQQGSCPCAPWFRLIDFGSEIESLSKLVNILASTHSQRRLASKIISFNALVQKKSLSIERLTDKLNASQLTSGSNGANSYWRSACDEAFSKKSPCVARYSCLLTMLWEMKTRNELDTLDCYRMALKQGIPKTSALLAGIGVWI